MRNITEESISKNITEGSTWKIRLEALKKEAKVLPGTLDAILLMAKYDKDEDLAILALKKIHQSEFSNALKDIARETTHPYVQERAYALDNEMKSL